MSSFGSLLRRLVLHGFVLHEYILHGLVLITEKKRLLLQPDAVKVSLLRTYTGETSSRTDDICHIFKYASYSLITVYHYSTNRKNTQEISISFALVLA